MARHEIEIREPGKAARRLPLTAGFSIGRHADNDATLEDSKVSGFHARVDADGELFRVIDLGSSNGTHVKDGPSLKAQESHALAAGGRFMVGFTEIEIFAVEEEPKQAEPTRMMPITDLDLPEPAKSEPAPAPIDSESATTAAETPITPDLGHASESATTPEIELATDLPPIPDDEPVRQDISDTASTEVSTIDGDSDGAPTSSMAVVPSKGVPVAPVSDLAPIAGQETTAAEEFPDIEATYVVDRGTGSKSTASRAPDRTEELSEGRTEEFRRPELPDVSPPVRGDGPDPDEETILSPPKRSDDTTRRTPTDGLGINPDAATVLTPRPDILGDAARGFTDEGTLVQTPGIDQADQGLEFIRPRLVIAAEKDRRVVNIDKREFVLGRKQSRGGQAVDCPIDSANVSSRHATITFRNGQFFIADHGSSNGTFVGGEKLGENSTRQVKADEQIVLGSTDLLLILDRDSEFRELPRGPYRAALEHLVKKKKVDRATADQLWQRCAVDGEHPAENLLTLGKIGVADWCGSLAAASKAEGRAAGSNTLLFAIIVIVLGAVVAFLLLQN